MLQLGGILSNSTVRITPRTSWWITAQHLFSSSIATSPIIETKSSKDDQNTKLISESQSITNQRSTTQSSKEELYDSIKSAVNVDELLHLAKKNFKILDRKHFSLMTHTLHEWLNNGRLNHYDKKFQEINNLIFFKTVKGTELTGNLNQERLPSSLKYYSEGQSRFQVRNLSVFEAINSLSSLADKQNRPTPLIQLLVTKISYSEKQLNLKLVADVLYSIATLNFYDEALLHRLKKEILEQLPKNTNSAVVGSIIKSLGLLRYRDEQLLDDITKWVVNNQAIVRTQDCCKLLTTVAYLGYTPTDFPQFIKEIVPSWNEAQMVHSSEWLNAVWSLSVLNIATEVHYSSVLNSEFLNRISDILFSTSTVQKLVNINAAAKILNPAYKGPFIPEDAEFTKIVKEYPKQRMLLLNSIVSALKVLLPSDQKYLNTNVDSKMGFLIDAEFCVDQKCTPYPLNCKSKEDTEIFRIAILSCTFSDFCREREELIGPILFYKRLLERLGYKVMIVPYKNINITDKLLTRAKYINDSINQLMLKDSS